MSNGNSKVMKQKRAVRSELASEADVKKAFPFNPVQRFSCGIGCKSVARCFLEARGLTPNKKCL